MLSVCLFRNNSRSRQPNNLKFGPHTNNDMRKVVKQVSFHIYKMLGARGQICNFFPIYYHYILYLSIFYTYKTHLSSVCLFPNNSRSRQPNNVKFGTCTQNYMVKVLKQVSFHIYKILGAGAPKCSFSLYELYKIKSIEN